MAVTDYKRFQVLNASSGYIGTPNALRSSQTGTAISLGFSKFVLSDPLDFGVPSNATITGVEFQVTINANLSTGQGPAIWKWGISITTLGLSDLTRDFVTINSPVTSDTTYTVGGDGELFGLSLTPSDLENLLVGAAETDRGGAVITSTTGANDPASPALRIYYTIPEPSPTVDVFRPGPNFMSSNVDLTKFRGLGDKTSPLATPPSSEDLFGFTSTIVPEGDNSSQATNSVFGDAANFGNLAPNRGGGTGISSTTGLLDTSKAPLSVRKGFRGI